jgi:CO/xanthine dehydrogenase FAD-binding subunit
MIPYNFDYYQPASIAEAVELYRQLEGQDMSPLYHAGGTELITLGRINLVFTKAVIDLKRIPECRTVAVDGDKLIIGSAVTLSELHDSRVFPLLGETGAGIADRTSRNKITFGGNLCGRFIYKEAVLPLLLVESKLLLAGTDGLKIEPIGERFDRAMRLGQGELLVQAIIDRDYASMPYMTVKKRKVSSIDYPLVTVAALRTGSGIRVAFSGVTAYPFRSAIIEEILNRRGLSIGDRVGIALDHMPAPVLSDIRGSAEYRLHVLKNTLTEIVVELGGDRR